MLFIKTDSPATYTSSRAGPHERTQDTTKQEMVRQQDTIRTQDTTNQEMVRQQDTIRHRIQLIRKW